MFPFIKEGLARGDRIVPDRRARAARRVPAAAARRGRRRRRGGAPRPAGSAVRCVTCICRRAGSTPIACSPAIRQRLSPGTGGSISRITGHGEWAGEHEHFLEYEARLNEVVPEGRDTVVCLYDLSKTSAALIVDVLRTHPLVILGGLLQENPFYVPMDQFLAQLREREAEAEAQAASR